MLLSAALDTGQPWIKNSADFVESETKFEVLIVSIESHIYSMFDTDFGHIEDPLPEAGQKCCGLLSCGPLASSRST